MGFFRGGLFPRPVFLNIKIGQYPKQTYKNHSSIKFNVVAKPKRVSLNKINPQKSEVIEEAEVE